ncbi:MAG: long-chain fatty acid--CoA ligase [Rhodobiaceae bacterium]|nr:long-chain fatty acid--CoA ligase [Rhodobiaceae bacterium]
MEHITLPNLFYQRTLENKEKPFLWSKQEGEWQSISWEETEKKVKQVAAGLKYHGIMPGDKIMIVSENRPEWVIADLAINTLNAITVPAYITNTEDDHRYIIEHSDAKAVIVSNNILANRVALAISNVETCNLLITIDEYNGFMPENLKVENFEDLISIGNENISTALHNLNTIDKDDVNCIIYTSGTGGRPKGVMLTHKSIYHNILGADELVKQVGDIDHKYLSLVPLSHAYEHLAIFLQIYLSSEIYFAEGPDKFAANLLETRPTLSTAVPRLFEVLYDRIRIQIKNSGKILELAFNRTVKLGKKNLFNKLNFFEKIEHHTYCSLIRKRISKRLGGKLVAFISGGSALNPDIGYFFLSLGVRIIQGYGQTEASPLISAVPPNKVKIETVGPPIKGVKVKLTEEGELLVKGDGVMKGYWKQEKETSETIIDGWLYTGDLADIDEDGFITIKDRKKEIIVNSGGDNIAPVRPESALTFQDIIHQAMVSGDRRSYLVAVIVTEPEIVKDMDEKDIEKNVAIAVRTANENLSQIEKIRRYIIINEPFSTDNGMLTPTMKLRRHMINEVYGEQLDSLYKK